MSESARFPKLKAPWHSATSATVVSTEPAAIPVSDHTLIRRIGKGSYGEVWLARNALGIYRAVKIVNRSTFDDDRPFERELAGIQRFEPISRSHESQLNILHVGRAEECFYYVMELADDMGRGAAIDEGSYSPRTLRSELLVRGRMPVDECIRLGLALTTALEHLHRHGLVHRDIKPSNIVFVNGIPKLADIGLVARAEATMSFVGTEGYLPPEGPGTPQADLFSLGKVLYELSTGRDRQQFPEYPTNVAELPDRAALAELNEVLIRACAPNIRDRYQTAAEMHADLALLQSGKSVSRLRMVERRLATLKRFSAAAATVILLVTGAFFYQARQTAKLETLAANNLKLAGEAKASAAESRENELRMRENLYAADINQIQHALASDNLRQALDLLRRNIPKPGEPDLRGFEWRYLWQQCQSEELFGLAGHTNTVGSTIAFSPDGRRLASGSSDFTVKIWDLATHQPVANLTMDSGTGNDDYAPSSVSYSPSGDLLAIACLTNVSIWDAKTFKKLRTLPEAIIKARFSQDGRHLLTFCDDGIILWETREWAEIKRLQLEGLSSEPYTFEFAFDFSPDNQRLGVVTDEGVELFSVPDLRQTGSLKDRMTKFRFLAFSPDGKTLAACTSEDGNLKLWDVGLQKELNSIPCHSDSILSVAFTPNGKLLATCSSDQTVKVWDVSSGKLLRKFIGHSDEVWNVAFSPDGKLLASASKDGAVKVWNPEALQASEMELHGCYPWGFRADGNLVASDTNGLLTAFDTRTLDKVNAQWFDSGVRSSFTFGNLFPDGFIGGVNAVEETSIKLDLWDLDRRERFCSVDNGVPTSSLKNVFRIFGGVFHPVFGLKKGLLITNPSTNAVELWRVPEGSRFSTLTNALMPALSPDETNLATVSADQSAITIWHLEGDQPLQMLVIPTIAAGLVVFSPDGHLLASSSKSSINIWELPSGRLVRTLIGHKREGVRLAFSPDGKTLASCGDDRTARLWHIRTGLELLKFEIRAADRNSGEIRFSPDGGALAAFSDGVTSHTRVWPAPLIDEIAIAEGNQPTDFPRNPYAWKARARAWERKGRLDEANRALGKVIQLCATNRSLESLRASSLRDRSRLHLQLGHFAEAGADNCARFSLIPRSLNTPANLIDLSAYYNGPLLWDGFPADIPHQPFLTDMPAGVHTLPGVEGVPFDLRGAVHLNRSSRRPGIPLSVKGIPVRQKCRRFHFLHATCGPGTQDEVIASYSIHYTDGREQDIPVIYGQDLRDFVIKSDSSDVGGAKVAWSGQNTEWGAIRLFARTWENPHPELEIQSIDFISKLTRCAPFLLAVTAE